MITPERIMTWAIPAFFVLIAVELALGSWRGRPSYHGSDAISSIGLGMMSQVVGVFTKVLTLGIYAWCLRHFALWALPDDSLWVWVSALLLYDFLYYWFHRGSHRVGVLWAAHVVHHQSEDYNLSTALRQTSSGALLGWVFYLPMALLGYPLDVFVVVALVDLLYQFWVHTEQVGRLGWFDRVFCSPSNHRAHHAVNDRYLDRNYGGILIVWDRLFGTFVEEDERDRPVFGTRAPLRSWNPLWANVEVYWALLQDARHARRWRDKLQVWLRPPGWRPADVAERFPKPAFDIHRTPYNPVVSRSLMAYCLVQFGLLLAMAMHFLAVARQLPVAPGLAYGAYLVGSLWVVCALLDDRPWAKHLECLRTLATAVVPLASGRWFGIAHLDGRLAVVMLVVFGACAIAVLRLGGRSGRAASIASGQALG